jgi:biopolymer transport protein ExbD
MKINLSNQGEDIRIEIIPLIDVIFCILTFFILAALQFARQQAIDVNLPQAKTGQPQQRELMLVSVDFIGQTYIDKQPVTRDQLSKALKAYLQKMPTGVVVLNAAKTASYEDVVQVLDLLRSVGGDRVALATIPTPTDQAAGAQPKAPTTPGAAGWQVPGQEPGTTPLPGQSPTSPEGLPGIPGLESSPPGSSLGTPNSSLENPAGTPGSTSTTPGSTVPQGNPITTPAPATP